MMIEAWGVTAMATMTEVSTFRLNLMRVGYLILFLGVGLTEGPALLHHDGWTYTHGVASCLLVTLSLLAGLGIRYPLQMLPVFIFELGWKAIWLLAIALPLWLDHAMDPQTSRMAMTCLAAMIIMPLLIPWPYVFKNYVMRPGDRWR